MIRLSSLSSTRSSRWPVGIEEPWWSSWVRVTLVQRTEARRVPADERAISPARLLQRCDLSYTPPMALGTGEAGAKEIAHQLDRELGSDHARAERDDVHVVVLNPLVGRERVVAKGAANAC